MFLGSHIAKDKNGVLSSLMGFAKYGNSCQILLSPPLGMQTEKMWNAMFSSALDVKKFIEQRKLQCFSHLPYTFNFAKAPTVETPYWIDRTKKELELASAMGFIGCVIHVGKAVKLDHDIAVENMFRAFEDISEYAQKKQLSAKLILETAAGQGSELLVKLMSLQTSSIVSQICKKTTLEFVSTPHIFGEQVQIFVVRMQCKLICMSSMKR